MHSKTIQFGGDSFEVEKVFVKNVSGTDTVAGGVYALDLGAADSDTSGAADPIRAAQQNLVGVLTANLGGILVVTPKIIKAGEIGEAVISGPVKVLVDGTTDVAKINRLKASNASTSLSKASAAVGSVDIGVGVALEAQAADSAVLIWVLFDGISFNKVINGAVS
jgi:hypothetical protein